MVSEAEIQKSIAGHTARNLELLKHIQEKGVAIDKPRSIEHHFYASSQRDAAYLAKELYGRGYMVLALMPANREAESSHWSIEAGIQRTPAEAVSQNVTEDLVRLAAKFNADYDGWGTLI